MSQAGLPAGLQAGLQAGLRAPGRALARRARPAKQAGATLAAGGQQVVG